MLSQNKIVNFYPRHLPVFGKWLALADNCPTGFTGVTIEPRVGEFVRQASRKEKKPLALCNLIF